MCVCPLALFSFPSLIQAVELKGLKFLISLISGELLESKPKTQNTYFTLQGYTNYTFIDYINNQNSQQCLSYRYIKQVTGNGNDDGRKQPIKVKCLTGKGNGTLQIVDSLKEVVTLLAPAGNNTKRNEPGNCALVLFFTKTCTLCAQVAPHFNAISKQFSDLRIGAIDAIRFHGLNTDFGIVGLPTIMLFHQGRPVVKFNDTASTVNYFATFVTKHTGIEPASANNLYVTSEDFHGPLSNRVEIETDYCLYLAWSFIVICSCYYFTKSKIYTYIIEVIQRNWHESAQT